MSIQDEDKKDEGILPNLGCAIQTTAVFNRIVREVFEAAQIFFSCEHSYKLQYQHHEREYGYYSSPDKEFFIIRDDRVPDQLTPCLSYLNQIHQFAKAYLVKLAEQIELPPDRLLSLIPDNPIKEGKHSSATLRLFHYHHENEKMLASEAHQDIGMLTIIPKSPVPGLEMYDFTDKGEWIEIEDSLSEDQLLIIFGETLSKITNHYFLAGAHRVRATPHARISIVYQLEAEPHARLDSSLFETKITGKFNHPFSMSAEEFVSNERKHRPSVNFD